MKILIISHNSFSKTSNNGKTLESIFLNFPKSNIAQLFFTVTNNSDFEFCYNYYFMSDLDVLKNRLFIANGSKNDRDYSDLNNVINFKLKKIRMFIKCFNSTLLRDFIWKIGKWKTDSFIQWVNNFAPDMIFFVAGASGFSHDISTYLSKKYNIPLVTYFTDDYLLFPKYSSLLMKIQRVRMKSFYDRTIQTSSLCFTICELMSKTYTEYFNKNFYSLLNIVDVNNDFIPSFNRRDLVISYFGGLHLNRWKSISKLGKIITVLSEKLSIRITLKVFTSSGFSKKIEDVFLLNNVICAGFVASEEIQKEFSNSDILLHVESDDSYYRSLTKLSVSTKIPEYLLTGKSILAFGPSDVASMKLIYENNIGYFIDSELDDDKIENKLADLFLNLDLRNNIAKNAYEYALSHFDPNRIRSDFESKIDKIVKK